MDFLFCRWRAAVCVGSFRVPLVPPLFPSLAFVAHALPLERRTVHGLERQRGREGRVTHETLEFLWSAHGSSGEEVVGVLNIAVGGGRHSVRQRVRGRAAVEPADVERDIVC